MYIAIYDPNRTVRRESRLNEICLGYMCVNNLPISLSFASDTEAVPFQIGLLCSGISPVLKPTDSGVVPVLEIYNV
jgi:hypothetical protein